METNTIISTNFSLATAVIANGAITGNPFSNPNNLLLVDGQVAESNPGSGTASDVTIGNYNYQNTDGTFGIPQNAIVTGFEFELIGYRGMQTGPVITVTPYLYDNLNGANQYYPYVTPFEGLTPDLDTYILGGQNYLFASQFSVDQVNNAKFALVANGDVYIDSFLVKVYYYVPSTDPDPTPSTDNCDGCDSVLQIQAMQLQLPFLIGDTAFYLKPFSMQYPDGTTAQPGDVGTCGGIVTFVFDEGKAKTANNNNFEENASLPYDPSDMNTPTWTILSNGVVKVDLKTTDNRGLDYKYPYTHADSRMSDHDANSKVIISNNGPYSFNILKRCDIGNLVSAPIEVFAAGTLVANPVTQFNFSGAGQTTSQDGTNPERVNIVIPGAGGTTPPIIVPGSTVSFTSGNTQVTSLSGTMPISGLNRGVAIQISTEQLQTIVSVTVGGIAATRTAFITDVTNNLRGEEWTCVNPPLGDQSVVVTLSGAAYLTFGAECLNGLDTTIVTGATQTASGTSSSPSLSITTTYDYSIVIDGLTTAMTPILYTPGAGQGLNWAQVDVGTTRQGGSSVQSAGLAPDAITMDYSMTQNTPWVYVAVEYKGITSAVPPSAGIASINGDTTPAQTITTGTPSLLSVITAAGNTEINYIGPTGGGSGNGSASISQTFDYTDFSLISGHVVAQFSDSLPADAVPVGAIYETISAFDSGVILEVVQNTTDSGLNLLAGPIDADSTGIKTADAGAGGSGASFDFTANPNPIVLISATSTLPTQGQVTVTIVYETGESGENNISNTEIAGVNFTGFTAPQAVVFGNGTSYGTSPILAVDTNPQFGDNSHLELAYTFQAVTNVLVTNVEVDVGKLGSPTDQVQVTIQTDNGSNAPSGTIVATSAAVTISSFSVLPINFVFTPVNLNGNQKYWIVIGRTGSQDAANYYITNGQGAIAQGIYKLIGSTWSELILGSDNVAIQSHVTITYTAGEVFPATSATNIYNFQKTASLPGFNFATPSEASSCDGIIEETVSAGDNINIITDGVAPVTGTPLTAGASYFVNSDSTLTTSGTIKVGRALVGGTTFFIRRY